MMPAFRLYRVVPPTETDCRRCPVVWYADAMKPPAGSLPTARPEDVSPIVRLKGEVAVVTGAAHGIGRAVAERLAAEGAAVSLLDIDADGAASVADEIASAGAAATALVADVTDRAAVRAALRQVVHRFGRPTILVNNAGAGVAGDFETITDADWDATLAATLTSCFVVSQEASPHMRAAGGGAVVNVASTAGQVGNRGQSAYAAAKAGMLGLTRVMAVELATDNIRVNAVSLGPIQTRRTELLPEAGRAARERRVALRRFGTVEEVAGVIAFLVSADAGYVTGSVVTVDGGFVVTGITGEEGE